MNSITARKEENRCQAIPHWPQLIAHRALSFRLSWFATMNVAHCYTYAHAALEAVIKLGFLSKSAESAVEAVVNVLSFVIFPKLTDGAVVSRQFFAFAGFTLASSSNGLDSFANHAHHLLSCESVHNVVIGLLVVADSARRPFATASGFDFATSLVVNASQDFPRGIVVRRLCVGT